MNFAPEIAGCFSALGIGMLLGLLRKRQVQDFGELEICTHTIAAIAGAFAFGLGQIAFMVILAAAFLSFSAYQRARPERPDRFSEITTLIALLLGGLAVRDIAVAVMLTVAIAMVLHAPFQLRKCGRDWISDIELRDFLLLLAAALAIPLLPNHGFGPDAVMNVRNLWQLMVLVMAASTLGYIALRVIGDRRGLAVAGFFSGFVSSSAAIAGFGQRVRQDANLLRPSVGAAMFAALASLILIAQILATVSAIVLVMVRNELIAFGLVLAVGGSLGLHGARKEQMAVTPQSRMFRPIHALYFVVFMAAVLLLSALLKHFYGGLGVIFTAFVAALAEVHVSVASIGQLISAGNMSQGEARNALLAVIGASVLSRSVLAYISGGSAYGLRVSVGLLLAWLAAVLTRALS